MRGGILHPMPQARAQQLPRPDAMGEFGGVVVPTPKEEGRKEKEADEDIQHEAVTHNGNRIPPAHRP